MLGSTLNLNFYYVHDSVIFTMYKTKTTFCSAAVIQGVGEQESGGVGGRGYI